MPPVSPPAAHLVVGRERELERIERFLAAESRLACLTLLGDAGIGKSTLWRAGVALAEADGWRTLRARGSELEAEQTDGGLADLLAGAPAAVMDALAPVQRLAIDAVLLRGDPPVRPIDSRTVAAATLAMLTSLAEDAPVLVAVDDSQWLDRASAGVLGQVSRRADPARIRFLTTRRAGTSGFEDAVDRDDRAVVEIGPLSVAALHHLLRDRLGQAFPRRALVQIDRAAGGNPLFALEIGRALLDLPALPAGGPLPIPPDTRRLVDSRIRDLPATTRTDLLRLALAPHTPASEAMQAAVAAEIVARGRDGRIEFVHPLFAAAIHDLAAPEERRAAHAEVAAGESDPERRARHLALSIDGPDPAVAAALDEAAMAARRGGSVMAAVELAELAVARTPSLPREALDRRRLLLADLLGTSGDATASTAIAHEIAAASADPDIRARAYEVLAGTAEYAEGIEAAMRYADLAVEHARENPVRRASVHAYAARAFDVDVVRKLEHARAAVDAAAEAGETGQVLAEALIASAEAQVFAGDGFDADALDRAEAIEAASGRSIPESRDAFYIRAWLEVHTEQLDAAERDFLRLVAYTRDGGLELRHGRAHIALTTLAIRRGDLRLAEEHLRAVEALDPKAVTFDWTIVARATLAAHRGQLEAARGFGETAVGRSVDRAWQLAEAHVARGLTELIAGASGPSLEAFEAARRIWDGAGIREPGIAHFEPDRIEALLLAGRLEDARRALDAFEAHGRRFDRPWILGTSLRARALLLAEAGELDAAAASLEAALQQHRRLPMRIVEARTQLALGRVERRRRRYQVARVAFAQARALAAEAGAGAWVAKADAELERTHVREAPAGLTPTERQIADLAAAGVTNREIASRLFVSSKTVEANLARAYRKLGIATRAQLGAALARAADQT